MVCLDLLLAIADDIEIYSGITSTEQQRKLVDACREMYKHSSWLIRLPGSINIPSFTARPDRIIDVPLVVRKARRSAESVRLQLGIAASDKVVLITFGGFEFSKLSAGWDLNGLLPPQWVGVLIGPGKTDWTSITESATTLNKFICIASEDWFLPDLMQASDVVLSKW
jgi:hypothetical protein